MLRLIKSEGSLDLSVLGIVVVSVLGSSWFLENQQVPERQIRAFQNQVTLLAPANWASTRGQKSLHLEQPSTEDFSGELHIEHVPLDKDPEADTASRDERLRDAVEQITQGQAESCMGYRVLSERNISISGNKGLRIDFAMVCDAPHALPEDGMLPTVLAGAALAVQTPTSLFMISTRSKAADFLSSSSQVRSVLRGLRIEKSP